jgi:hypothetical protein
MKVSYIHHWHLHRPGETIDAQIEEPDRWGKGPYPVNFDGLLTRTVNARHDRDIYLGHAYPEGENSGKPLLLEMEVGQQVFDYRHERDRLALEHIGKVVGALGGVDCVYGNGWGFHLHLGDEMMLVDDLAAYALIGCPDRLAITAYGKWDHHWAPNLKPKIDRANRLADAIKWKQVNPVLFISPFVARQGDMTLSEWNSTCHGARKVADLTACDLMIWWDGGPNRRPYVEAEPYIIIARQVLL